MWHIFLYNICMIIINDEKKKQEYINKYDFGQYLTNLEDYRQAFRLVSMEKKSYLYTYPEERKYIFFLVEGKFSICATSENGSQMLVRQCHEFICLGDMELLGHSEPSNAIEMDTKCIFLALDVSICKEKLLSDVVFLRQLATGLSEKLNYFARMQFHVRSINPKQRVISHIIDVAGENLFYKENLRKTAIILSISYRHLHRILSELVSLHVLTRQNGGYKIIDMPRLEQLFFEYE